MSGAFWAIDRVAAEAALQRLLAAKTVLMPTHPNVDADGLATPLALMHALAARGVRVVPVVGDGIVPESLQFLPGFDKVVVYGRDPLPEWDLVCLADCSDRKRLGAFYTDDPSRIDAGAPIVNIDHHVTNERYGAVAIVEPEASSASEVMADLFRLWDVRLTTDIAQCLLAGIYGDTLGLRTESTTPRTLRTAAALIEAGGEPGPIVDALFRIKPPSTVCLWRSALENVRWQGPVIYTEITVAALAECGADRSEAEGLVNFLAGTRGSQLAAILYETPTGWRVSMRSLPGVDVAQICAEFGGGGHPRAAGCSVTGDRDDLRRFVERVAELVSDGDDGVGGG